MQQAEMINLKGLLLDFRAMLQAEAESITPFDDTGLDPFNAAGDLVEWIEHDLKVNQP